GTPLQTNDTKILSGRLGVDLTSDKLGAFTFRSWFLSEIYHQTFTSIAPDRSSESLTRLQTVPSQAGRVSIRWSRDIASLGSIYGGAEMRNVRGPSDRVGNVLTLANEALKAERAKNVEAGILVSGLRDRVYLRAVAFCTGISDPISNVTLNATPTLITRQRQNLGRTLTCGVEADSVFR